MFSTTIYDDSITDNVHPMVTRAKLGINKPKLYNVTIFDNYIESSTFKQYLVNLKWFKEMQL